MTLTGRERGAEEAFAAVGATAPEGWRVELIEGEIRVVPLDDGKHAEIVSEITGQMHDQHTGLRSYRGIGLRLPREPFEDKVIADLVVAPKRSLADHEHYHPPGIALLVAEVTSRSTGDSDRKGKLRGYARAGIPHYLLIDREADTATLFSEPEGETYVRRVSVKLSGKLELPEPLGFVLDTSEF